MKRILIAALLVCAACAGYVPPPTAPIPQQPPDPAHVQRAEDSCRALWFEELERQIDDAAFASCREELITGRQSVDSVRAFLRASEEYAQLQERKKNPPLTDKATFVQTYQGNMGSIKLPGCGLHLDNLFDPFLLWAYLHNRECFERMLQAHAERGDNVVSVTPTSGYHEFNSADVWHQPEVFAAFLQDIRSHRNIHGEPIRVQVFFAGDAHFPTMRPAGTYEHWLRDVSALAAVIEDRTDATVVCWECRHIQEQVSAKMYMDMGRYLAARFPRAVHAQHLVQNSSSWSSWPCNADNPRPQCIPAGDADDPAEGDEAEAWRICVREGWCDVFLFQFLTDGSAYTWWETWPPDEDARGQGVDARGALGRYWHIVVRLGTDPQSERSRGRYTRRGWTPPPYGVIAYEHIYNHHWNHDPGRLTEGFAVEFCKQALRIGGWGCGSASWRR